MNPDEILKRVRDLFKEKGETTEETVKMNEVVTEDGATIYFDGDLAEGSTIWFINEGENVPVPVGEYLLPDGTTLTVTEAGVVGTIMAAAATDEAQVSEPVVEETLSANLTAEDITKIVMEAIEPLQTQITKLSGEKEVAETKVKELETKLANEPASDGVQASPEGKTNTKMTNLAKNGKVGLDKVYSMLYN